MVAVEVGGCRGKSSSGGEQSAGGGWRTGFVGPSQRGTALEAASPPAAGAGRTCSQAPLNMLCNQRSRCGQVPGLRSQGFQGRQGRLGAGMPQTARHVWAGCPDTGIPPLVGASRAALAYESTQS